MKERMVKHNGRDAILLTRLNPLHIDRSGPVVTVVCSDCGTWQSLVKRNRMRPHKADEDDPEGVLCRGTGQQYVLGECPDRWRERRDRKAIDPRLIRNPSRDTASMSRIPQPM